MPQQMNIVSTVRLLRTIRRDRTTLIPILVGPSGTLLVAHGSDITLQPLQNGSISSTSRLLKGHHAPIIGWNLSHDGDTLASIDTRGSLHVMEVASGRTLYRITLPPMGNKPISRLTLSPDGRYVGADHAKRHYCLVDLRSGKIIFAPPKAAANLFSPTAKPW